MPLGETPDDHGRLTSRSPGGDKAASSDSERSALHGASQWVEEVLQSSLVLGL